MGEYFRNWKRKIGVTTLIIASLFMVGWVRSLTIQDSFYRYTVVGSPAYLEAESAHGYVTWWSSTKSFFQTTSTHIMWTFSPVQGNRVVYNTDNNQLHWFVNWLLKLVGIEIAIVSDAYGKNREVWSIPYWSIVVPLGALSAWLLLSRRRRPKVIESPTAQAV